jgi:hypothetical protein
MEAMAMLVASVQTLKSQNDALQAVLERQNARLSSLERGRAPVISYLVPSGLGGVALGLVPLGLIASRRKRFIDGSAKSSEAKGP